MNTRILRMCRRSELKGQICYLVKHLGQLQPVLFSHDGNKRFRFRAEDVAEYHGEIRSCISVLDFRFHKPEIRKLFAELEGYHRDGTETPAARSWREYQEGLATPKASPPIAESVELDLFGEPLPLRRVARR